MGKKRVPKYVCYVGILIGIIVIVGSYFLQSDFINSKDDTRRQVKKYVAFFLIVSSLIGIAFMVYLLSKK